MKIDICSLVKINSTSFILLTIPLALSAFTHLWNPIGFPSVEGDEGTYIRRAMLVLAGLGPQESTQENDMLHTRLYGHPYFGQLFLASVLGLVGYPNSLNPSADENSIELLYFVPRVLMGILAVVDTFLIYQITKRHYNRNTALMASVLFAVMPMTWILRRVYLDNLLMPFLLSSILFAFYLKGPKNKDVSLNFGTKYKISKNILILLSGIFLGLAIYTKIPAFTMIPLVGTMVFFNSGKSMRSVGIWFTPVILIPLFWPAHALLVGQFDDWQKGVLSQLGRTSSMSLIDALNTFFRIDPLLFLLGGAGLVFAAIKRDFWLLLWVIPYFIFVSIDSFINYHHLIPLLPAFCIAAAKLIYDASIRIRKETIRQIPLPIYIISTIGIFGLVSTSILITMDINSFHFEGYATLVQHIVNYTDNSNNNKLTIIGPPIYYWIPKYGFHKDFNFITMRNDSIFIVDDETGKMMSNDIRYDDIYNSTELISTFRVKLNNYDVTKYPFTSLTDELNFHNNPLHKIDVRSNY